MTKFKQYYIQMEEQNKDLFDTFQVVHDNFKTDKQTYANEFHTKGQEVLDIIRDWDRRLCGGMERGKNSQYSSKLSEKFWGEVKKRFSHIELVGVRSTFVASAA